MNQLYGQDPVYPIGVVQKITGLTGRQIRYYEKQGLISPQRTKGNQRMYTAEEVDLLLRIKHFREKGYNIEGIRRALESQLGPDKQTARDLTDLEHNAEDESILDRLERPNRLTSLYPISNRSELERLLRDFPK